MSNDAIELEGTVIDILGGGKYKVLINDMDLEVTCYAAGKMKKFNIRIIPGDIVTVELSPYEPTKGRITYRTINKDIGKKKRRPLEVVSQDAVMPASNSPAGPNDKTPVKSAAPTKSPAPAKPTAPATPKDSSKEPPKKK